MEIKNLYDALLLKKEYTPDIRYYYYRIFDSPYHMAFHQHPQVEIMYVEQGSCRIKVDREVYPLSKNEFILINGDIPHGMEICGNDTCRILNIEYAFIPCEKAFFSIKDFIHKLGRTPEIFKVNQLCFVLKDTEEVYTTLKRIIYEVDTRNVYSFPQIQILFWQLFLDISKIIQDNAHELAGPAGHYYIQKALRYIHSNYYRNIDVEDMAGYLKLNRSYFHRIFKQMVGCTPVEYLTDARMKRAKVLLTRTDLSIQEVSKNVGIQSQQYFTYLFKKHHGASPGSFRKQYQINQLK